MLKESWVAGEAMTHSTVSYILQMRDKLENLREMAKRHMESQCKQKVWYDKHARDRELQQGQKVLVLLPIRPSKLLAVCKARPINCVQKSRACNHLKVREASL